MKTLICRLQTADRKSFTLYLIILINIIWISSSQAQQNTAAIQGKMLTEKGLPLPFANVHLKDKNKGALTDEEGLFTIDQVSPGKYILVISHLGYATKEIQLKLEKGQVLNIPPLSLLENGSDLVEFTVTDSKINPLANKNTHYVARMPLENLENPQVYHVVSKELIKEQVITDIGETVRNAPGVVPITYASGGFGTTFRGFSTGINARNGMEAATGRSSLDIANVERIEILKGPSATLFGANVSSFGGVVNLVTKAPMEERQTEITYTTGSFNLHRIAADVNTPLNEDNTVLLRVNTALNREKSFMDYGFNNTFIIAPSLLYKASERLTITLDLEYFNAISTRPQYSRYAPNAGITSPRQLQIGYRTSLYHEDADSQTAATKLFAQAKYQLGKNWTSTTLLSFLNEDVKHSYQAQPTWISPTEVARSVGMWGPIYANYTNLQQNFNGEFQTGNIGHKVLIGANLRAFDSRSEYSTTDGFIDTVNVTNDFRPLRRFEMDSQLIPRFFPGWHSHNDLTHSAYIADVIQLTDRLSTMLSLRLDHFKRPDDGDVAGFEQTALAPKVGIAYQVLKDRVSVFGNYMSGFQNQAPRMQPNGQQLSINPVFATQSEGGIKAEVFEKKLSTTISYYNIAIDNAVRINADGFAIQDGQQVSKGLDFELIANPITGLNLVTGYAYNDNRINKASDESIAGNKANDAPEHVANFWASYTFQHKLKGFGLGFGGNHVGSTYMFTDNVFTIPSYTLWNATVFYDQTNWRIGLKLNNITNEQYWSFWGVAQAPMNFAANLSLRF
ncbi:TonB-dependent siderophore receptor [Belliella kenyensis]|uniref:TonB-dependent siderophore receptor n=1 Tax=Belliella kenyensis TaxID=1472724 RepID=A0ABV8ELN6_9BACT|nr:TonB-dependent receptor [Belliella kenyensis]MCH7400811.1 TonB-dependent receptor [Belliella kenyensis]MDN3601901.1 TonB-dependent receptor [Belliella kenyensis]